MTLASQSLLVTGNKKEQRQIKAIKRLLEKLESCNRALERDITTFLNNIPEKSIDSFFDWANDLQFRLNVTKELKEKGKWYLDAGVQIQKKIDERMILIQEIHCLLLNHEIRIHLWPASGLTSTRNIPMQAYASQKWTSTI